MPAPQVRVFDTKAQAAAAAAALLKEAAGGSVCLPGGTTVKAVYFLLAKDRRPPWHRTEFWFADERYAPPNHPDSNFRAFADLVAAPLGLPPEAVRRIPTEGQDPAADARRYETALRARWPQSPAPAFDALLLALGADGTVASLVPGVAARAETERWVAPVSLLAEREPGAARHEGPPARITLTPAALRGARAAAVLAVGEAKRQAVRDAAAGGNPALPAGATLLVDREAAALL